MSVNTPPSLVSRRRFLQWFAASGLAAYQIPSWASADGANLPGDDLEQLYHIMQSQIDLPVIPDKQLRFENLHTGETLTATYWAEGNYQPDSLQAIDHVLRDHRADESYPMNTDLLDLLYDLQQTLDNRQPIQIISAYRSPQTNAKLREKSNGVAKRSLHMQGKAIDIRLPQCELCDIRGAALSLRRGGVGYYPRSGFIHVDVGRVRQWG